MKKEGLFETRISEEKIRELLIYYKEEIKALGLNMVWPAVFKKHYHGKCKTINTRVISGFSIFSPCGDEEVCSLMFCENCQSYHLNCYHDQFIGDGDFTYKQEVTKEEAEVVKEAILKCENPHDKHCRCKYHEKLGEILYRDFMEFAKQEMLKKDFKWSDEEKTWVKI